MILNDKIAIFQECKDCSVYEQCFADESIKPWTLLYHIIPLDYLIENLQQHILRFTRVDTWKTKDIREGFICNYSRKMLPDEPMGDVPPAKARQGSSSMETGIGLMRHCYAMCWSTEKCSKAMWEEYGENRGHGIGVQIGVAAKDLVCSVCNYWKGEKGDECIRYCRDKVSLCSVTYVSRRIMDQITQKACMADMPTNDQRWKSVFSIKDDRFRYENEVRLFTSVEDEKLLRETQLPIQFEDSCILSCRINPLATKSARIDAANKLDISPLSGIINE